MTELLICLALNIAAGIYLQVWKPIITFYQAIQLKRMLNRARIAGL